MLKPTDSVRVAVLVDNATDNLSSTPAFVETEWASHWRRGMRVLSGRCWCCAAHGLSCLITVRSGETERTLLFDTGPEDWVFERNVTRLGVDLGTVEALVLSHGHVDHAGGMPRALQMISLCNGGRSVPTYMHPGMFWPRAVKFPDGSLRMMEDIPSVMELNNNGAEVLCTEEEQSLLGGLVYLSGEIPRVTEFEEGFSAQYRRTENGWEHDPLTIDERYLAVDVSGKGLIVFTACSHAGVVNVLLHARDRFPDIPLYGIVGGLHLSGVTEKIIPQTVSAIEQFGLRIFAVGHCTGWRAINALAAAYGDAVVPSAVGKSYQF